MWQHLSQGVRDIALQRFSNHNVSMSWRSARTKEAKQRSQECFAALKALPPVSLSFDPPTQARKQTMMQNVFSGWQHAVQVQATDKCFYKLHREDMRHRTSTIMADMDLAYSSRDFALFWRLARALSGKSLGPKLRQYNAAKMANPTAAGWIRYLEKPGTEGGGSAIVLDDPLMMFSWHHGCLVPESGGLPVSECAQTQKSLNLPVRT
ncbi:unnamed protein product [Polarella glacialis]|uniref:Uncharacterized protein n=1 Tax=Polarella glacialis TaxID=89957 RepID=A0A813JRI2_POLGL|nr:unnamed protein product [Polarella glacialis]